MGLWLEPHRLTKVEKHWVIYSSICVNPRHAAGMIDRMLTTHVI